jgi:hypothetical protein
VDLLQGLIYGLSLINADYSPAALLCTLRLTQEGATADNSCEAQEYWGEMPYLFNSSYLPGELYAVELPGQARHGI